MSDASLFPGYVKPDIPVEREPDVMKKSSSAAVDACEGTAFPSSVAEGLSYDNLKALIILFLFE